MVRASWTAGAPVEATLELEASSLREVKGRIRPLFTQEWVAASAGAPAGPTRNPLSRCNRLPIVDHSVTLDLQAKIGRPRHQLLVFLDHPGRVAPTNNGCERLLRPAVVQRKMTNGYRAMWAATGEANIRTVVDTACLTGHSPFGTILSTVGP